MNEKQTKNPKMAGNPSKSDLTTALREYLATADMGVTTFKTIAAALADRVRVGRSSPA